MATNGAAELHELTVRKIFQDALAKSFGLSHSGAYMDILYLSPKSDSKQEQSAVNLYEFIIRIAEECV